MVILQIEHPVPNFDAWKTAFDSDPVDRAGSGVLRHRIFQPVDDSKYVIIELEFKTLENAEAMLTALQVLWKRVEGTVMMDPKARIVEVVEDSAY